MALGAADWLCVFTKSNMISPLLKGIYTTNRRIRVASSNNMQVVCKYRVWL